MILLLLHADDSHYYFTRLELCHIAQSARQEVSHGFVMRLRSQIRHDRFTHQMMLTL